MSVYQLRTRQTSIMTTIKFPHTASVIRLLLNSGIDKDKANSFPATRWERAVSAEQGRIVRHEDSRKASVVPVYKLKVKKESTDVISESREVETIRKSAAMINTPASRLLAYVNNQDRLTKMAIETGLEVVNLELALPADIKSWVEEFIAKGELVQA